MGNALVYLQFVDKRTGQCEVDILTVFLNGYNGSKFFYNA